MRNIKKTASLFLAYLFVLSILPLGILAKTASAEGLPEYLTYSENYLRTKLQYKDVSLVGYINPNVIDEYVVKRISKNGESYISHGYPYVIGDKFITTDEGIYDVYEEKYIKTHEEISEYAKKIISEKYGENSKLYNCYLERVEEDGKMWLTFSATSPNVNKFRIYGVITPESKIIEGNFSEVNSNGAWSYDTNFNGEEATDTFIVNYDKYGNKKQVKIDKSHLNEYTKFVSKDTYIYVSTYTKDGIITLKYDINKEVQTGVRVNPININNISVDKNGDIWGSEGGYVQKFDGTSWTNIYKVDSRMNDVEVYDKDHMIVTGWWYEKNNQGYDVPKGIYTIINNGAISEPGNGQGGETPQNPTPGNNGGGNGSETDNGGDSKTPVIVDKGTDDTGNKFVEVPKLPNKDSVNSIEVDTKDSKAFTAEITDINTVKEGKGSLNIKGGNTVINLPFSTINKDLLKDGSKIVLTSKVENNSDITKNIKGLKKVFNFDLSVVDKDNNVTAIHQFNGGEAEITITLSNDELKGLDKEKLAVFYYNEETKKFEMMDTKVDGNNVTFKTSHFSKYIIAEKSGNSGSQLPQTGSLATQNQVLAIGVLILIAGAATLYSKRKRA